MLKRLRRLREEAALTQRQLSERSKITQATIVHAEKGGDVRPSTLKRLADALCVHPRDLIGAEE